MHAEVGPTAPIPRTTTDGDRTPPTSVDEARARVGRAQADVVRFEIDLENTRERLKQSGDDLSYLGGRVEAAQRRVTAAQAEVDLAQALKADARDGNYSEVLAPEADERSKAELDRARADLDQALEQFTQAGGSYHPDGTPIRPAPETPDSDAPRATDTAPDRDPDPNTTSDDAGTRTENRSTTTDPWADAALREWRNDPAYQVNMAFTDQPGTTPTGAYYPPPHPTTVDAQLQMQVAAGLGQPRQMVPGLHPNLAYPLLTAFYDNHVNGVPMAHLAARFTADPNAYGQVEQTLRAQWSQWRGSGHLFWALDTLSRSGGVYVPNASWGTLLPPPRTWNPGRAELPVGSGMSRGGTTNRLSDVEAGYWSIRVLEGQDRGSRVQDLLPPHEVETVRRYAGDDFDFVNSALRGQSYVLAEDRPRLLPMVQNLDAALSRRPFPQPFLMQRGVNTDFINMLGGNVDSPAAMQGLVGTVYTDPGYMSGSLGATTPLERDVYIAIRVPAGHNGLSTMPFVETAAGEREILLPRNTSMVFHAAYQAEAVQPGSGDRTTMWFLEAEVVPLGWRPGPDWRPAPYGDIHEGYQEDAARDSDSDDDMYASSDDDLPQSPDGPQVIGGRDGLPPERAAVLLDAYYDHYVDGKSLDSIFRGDSAAERQFHEATTYWRESGALRQALHDLGRVGYQPPPGGWDSIVNPTRRTVPLPDTMAAKFGNSPGQSQDLSVTTDDGTVLPALITQRGPRPVPPRFEWNRIHRDGRDIVEVQVRLARQSPPDGVDPHTITRAEQRLVADLESQVNDGRPVPDGRGGTRERVPYTLRNGSELRLKVELVDPADVPDAFSYHGRLQWAPPVSTPGQAPPDGSVVGPDILAWFGLTESTLSQVDRTLQQAERNETNAREAQDRAQRAEHSATRGTRPPRDDDWEDSQESREEAKVVAEVAAQARARAHDLAARGDLPGALAKLAEARAKAADAMAYQREALDLHPTPPTLAPGTRPSADDNARRAEAEAMRAEAVVYRALTDA
ncbi:ADP-ribosyltransferase, partial [Marinitenerispora sediminis]